MQLGTIGATAQLNVENKNIAPFCWNRLKACPQDHVVGLLYEIVSTTLVVLLSRFVSLIRMNIDHFSYVLLFNSFLGRYAPFTFLVSFALPAAASPPVTDPCFVCFFVFAILHINLSHKSTTHYAMWNISRYSGRQAWNARPEERMQT